MTYYDRLNAFFLSNEAEPLPASAQIVYLHLLHISNQCRSSSFRCSENRLAFLTQLNKKTVLEARRILERAGYIECETVTRRPSAGTLYRIIDFDETAEELPAAKPQLQLIEKPKYSSENSAEVLKAWQECGGEKPRGFELIELENRYGAEELIKFIAEAGRLKKYPRMNVTYLQSIINGRAGNGKSERVVQLTGAEQQYAITADELPAEYRHYQGGK